MEFFLFLKQISLILYFIIVATTMVVVVMENRQPMKTVAWLLVLSFLPVLGIILYFIFGQNIRKERHINKHSLDPFTRQSMLEYSEQKNLQLPEEHEQLIQLFTNQNLALPFVNNDVEFYTSGRQFFPVLLAAIREAKHHIHLTTYIIDNDPLGNEFADALIAKAQEGVEVRLIYDDVGCWRTRSKFFKRMQKGGVEVCGFLPVYFPALTSKINYRNHRKICIIDGRTGFIGGMNIAQRYIDGTGTQPWRDTHLRVQGGCVNALQRTFLEDWYFVCNKLIADPKYYDANLTLKEDEETDIPTPGIGRGEALAQVVTSSPTAQWHNIMQGYVRILLQARKYVYMETPYFLPTEPVVFAMRTAALSGVDVRLMLPFHGDSKIVEWASRSFLPEIIKAGVKVYLYKAGFLHSKLLISDDTVCTCGSTNIDFRSFENNFEANIFFYDKEVTRRMKRIFLDDLRHCVLANEVERKHRTPFLDRFVQSVFRLFSPLL